MQYARITRREFLDGATAITGAALLGVGRRAMSEPSSYFAYVGSRTTRERNAHGDGINVYRGEATTGQWTHLQVVTGLANPSFLALDRKRQFLYAIHGDLSDISAYRIEANTGKLAFINSISTFGKNPVHLTIDPTNRFVVVANHLSSSLVVLERHADGSLGALADKVTLTGQIGPHRTEQPFSKPHQVQLDRAGKFLVVPDKGLDQVFSYRLDPTSGKLTQAGAGTPRSRDGSGPRHVAFHPTNAFAYVVNELDSTVTASRFRQADGSLEPFQVVTTLPYTFVGNSRAAEIAVSDNGRFLYASNRGYDSVVTFAVDQPSGRLAQPVWASSRGKTPRFFALDPGNRHLFVANEEGDTIVPFNADVQTGVLTASGDVIKTGSPVCIVFAQAL